MLDSTPDPPSNDRSSDMALDDDMTTPSREPRDEGTPADRAEGTMSEDQYLGTDSLSDLEADGGADGSADRPAGGSGAGFDDPTTATDEDPRLA